MLPRPLPTPVLAFAIRHLGADAGVVVDGVAQPAAGQRLQGLRRRGSQIVPPADAEISAAIDAVGPLRLDPDGRGAGRRSARTWSTPTSTGSAGVVDPASPRDLEIVYTPLHGVGGDVVLAGVRAGRVRRAARRVRAGRSRTRSSRPWRSRTRRSPARWTWRSRRGRGQDADIVLANDPDADRCAVAVPTPSAGGWRMLRGDEVGALLGQHLIRRDADLRRHVRDHDRLVVACSARSPRRTAWATPRRSPASSGSRGCDGLRYGYEEALGYCVDPDAVLDKDGISAALLVAELAATPRRRAADLADLLDEIAGEYGLHATDQLSARVDDLAEIDAAMDRLRGRRRPRSAAARSSRSTTSTQGSADLPPTDGLRFRLADGGRVVVRPSGTEPKIKCYLEVVVPVVDGDVAAARVRPPRSSPPSAPTPLRRCGALRAGRLRSTSRRRGCRRSRPVVPLTGADCAAADHAARG